MKIEVESGKPGRVLVLDVPGVGRDAIPAGAAVAIVVAAGKELQVQGVELLENELRVRTVSEVDDLYQLGARLERRVLDAVKATDIPRRIS